MRSLPRLRIQHHQWVHTIIAQSTSPASDLPFWIHNFLYTLIWRLIYSARQYSIFFTPLLFASCVYAVYAKQVVLNSKHIKSPAFVWVQFDLCAEIYEPTIHDRNSVWKTKNIEIKFNDVNDINPWAPSVNERRFRFLASVQLMAMPRTGFWILLIFIEETNDLSGARPGMGGVKSYFFQCHWAAANVNRNQNV